ncbi:MAG: thioredoxin domain-containing protein [Microscillaceae bacterium]|nr:thioredoxin domain-containing protein [Microscillaceae bacterium]MDW8461120.1 thioredoxin domain-containing protein [Cytophagales bacterium]
MHKYTNRLVHASSPYLLQHAHNPVDWYEWCDEALQKAQTEDKPIIVSIGYAACHWCHVMERECFENEEIAQLMNQYFVCIKIDREERPDLDAIYMEAVQAMGMNGGWPLNAFLTPQGKPFYAGTYFPPKNWIALLQNIHQIFKNDRERLEQSAEQFRQVIAQSEVKKYKLFEIETEFRWEEIVQMVAQMIPNFDTTFGGMDKAPKFPMPSIYAFLLRYQYFAQDRTILQQIELTLNEMAKGGIYDQIFGGFARYSVDALWFAPHFEKMLYDNAQLIALYAETFALTKNENYKKVVEQTIEWLKAEMLTSEGAFFSALDADSEGIEGKFYTWKTEEITQLLAQEAPLCLQYYNCQPQGNWEHNTNILHRKITDEEFAQKNNLSLAELKSKIKLWNETLLAHRKTRIRPLTDDKILTSWNALTLKGLVIAYQHLQKPEYLQLAQNLAHFIDTKLTYNGNQLWHTYKNGNATIKGFLDDYATVIEAYIHLYQTNFQEQWLLKADALMQYAIQNFYDAADQFFFFTDATAEKLIARKKELFDNVIPCSNSIMGHNLHDLAILLDKPNYYEMAQKMIGKTKKLLKIHVEYLTNWASLMLKFAKPLPEFVIIGDQYTDLVAQLYQHYLPQKIVVAQAQATENPVSPLLAYRSTIDDKTTVYLCFNKTCLLPVHTVSEALELYQKSK